MTTTSDFKHSVQAMNSTEVIPVHEDTLFGIPVIIKNGVIMETEEDGEA